MKDLSQLAPWQNLRKEEKYIYTFCETCMSLNEMKVGHQLPLSDPVYHGIIYQHHGKKLVISFALGLLSDTSNCSHTESYEAVTLTNCSFISTTLIHKYFRLLVQNSLWGHKYQYVEAMKQTWYLDILIHQCAHWA